MLDSKFFDILTLENCDYEIGNYLVTVFKKQYAASFHRIDEISESAYTLHYAAFYNTQNNTFNIYDMGNQPISVAKSRMGNPKSSDDYCISNDTFNLLIMNYA